MDGYQRAARVIFAIGLIAMGVVGLVYGDFAMQWQPVPAGIPWHTGLAYLCAAIELVLGVARNRRYASYASRPMATLRSMSRKNTR